jgi:hypothetical protein
MDAACRHRCTRAAERRRYVFRTAFAPSRITSTRRSLRRRRLWRLAARGNAQRDDETLIAEVHAVDQKRSDVEGIERIGGSHRFEPSAARSLRQESVRAAAGSPRSAPAQDDFATRRAGAAPIPMAASWHRRADRIHLPMWLASFSFSQTYSMSSVSGNSSNGSFTVHGFVNVFGSSMVTSMSIWPTLMRRNRSVI